MLLLAQLKFYTHLKKKKKKHGCRSCIGSCSLNQRTLLTHGSSWTGIVPTLKYKFLKMAF